MKRLVLIDGMSVFYRGYYAMPGLSMPDGTPTGGVFGFASIAIEVIKKLDPDYVAVAWDKSKTATSKRKEIYPEYKAGRKRPPEDFFAQIPLLHELLESFGWPVIELDDYEADDIIGTISIEAAAKDVETCVVSGDYDMMQLLTPHTQVYINKKGSDMIRFTETEFEEKYGVKLAQFVDYKALVGDSSDNIPGVRGIGPKAAQALLSEYETLDGIYEHIDELKGAQKTKLTEDRDNAYMSRELARIWCDAPLQLDWDEADINNTNLGKVAKVLEKFEFHSLTKRLPAHMQDQHKDHALSVNDLSTADLVEKPWPEQLLLNGPVVLEFDGDDVYVSPNRGEVYKKSVQQIDKAMWRLLEMTTVVAYDVKALYHYLADAGVQVQFSEIHDIRQAAFLLDPLRRDTSLESLMGGVLVAKLDTIAALWQVYDWQVEGFENSPEVSKIAHEFDFPFIYTLFLVEHRGVKIDVQKLAKMSEELGAEHKKLEQEMYAMAGAEFNIASPQQLSEVLFTKLMLPTTGVKKGKTGYSTDQKTLDKLRGQHPIIELIERTRELAKLKNTYVDTLPTMVDSNDRLHTTFSQDVASTGRLSSSNPNLQNIPVRSDLGRKIREAFVPEQGNVLVSADYSQFELRLAAILAGDEELIKDFNSDVDIHTKTAARVYNIPIDDVTKQQRRDAKVINFGVLYGMSPHGLSVATGMSLTEAKRYIDQYFEMRAPIRKYIEDTLTKAENEGYVETYYGRRRPTPDVRSSNWIVRESARRAAANMPIQGTEADLMKRAMIQLESELAGLGEQVLQVHDSVLVETPRANAEKVSEILRKTMEAVAPELKIKLKVDVSVGDNWGEL